MDDFNEQFQKAHAEPVSCIGTTAPTLMLEPLEGDVFLLESLRGKLVVLNFCATKVAASTVEMLWLKQLANHKSKHSVEIIGISAKKCLARSEPKA